MNTESKVLMDMLLKREDLIPSLKQASIFMEVLRKKVRMLEAEHDDVPPDVVPNHYAHIKPLVDTYYADLNGWYLFLKHLRDGSGWGTKDPRWRKLHELMRLANINAAQNLSRSMAGEAADIYSQAHPFNKGDRTKYMTYCRALWKEQITLKLKNARSLSTTTRLPQDQRAEITDEFWQTIREQIENGTPPTPPEGLLG